VLQKEVNDASMANETLIVQRCVTLLPGAVHVSIVLREEFNGASMAMETGMVQGCFTVWSRDVNVSIVPQETFNDVSIAFPTGTVHSAQGTEMLHQHTPGGGGVVTGQVGHEAAETGGGQGF